MTLVIDSTTTQIYDLATKHEWIETNGLGGYASSTVAGANTRRYHGLLVAALRPPIERYVMLAKMDEVIHTSDKSYELSCNKYQNAIHPDGYIFLQKFEKDFFPQFTYKANGIRLKKTIACVHGENTTLLIYEAEKANQRFTLELNPLVAGRSFHELTAANGELNTQATFENGIFSCRPYEALPPIYLSLEGSDFSYQPAWYYHFEYTRDLERGQRGHEDLFSYGKLSVSMQEGDRIGIIISTENPAGKDPFVMLTRESLRRQRLLNQAGCKHESLEQLILAADQFIVQKNHHYKSIIAGYPWFSDWGRDSMIALPGLCLASGRQEDAKMILKGFSRYIDQGMIPNRFPDFEQQPEYNTIDASLWFFIAVYKYWLHTQDRQFIQHEMLPALLSIIEHHDAGTRYNIRVEDDGLLSGGEDGVQLTWMDAKVDDWVVTPRKGKCVEINALWYNALEIMAHFYRTLGQKEQARHFTLRAKAVKRAFLKTFWYKEGCYLYDYVNEYEQNTAIRPNQVFTISLPYTLLSPTRAAQVLEVIESQLLTPYGLRSLSPEDPAYRPYYTGNVWQRDAAYHQGTVWSWLMGPYIDALIRVRGNMGREQARIIINNLIAHLGQAGMGSISEIFDAEPPHEPRGCYAQAWSVSELIRVCVDHELFVPLFEKHLAVRKNRQPVFGPKTLSYI